MALIAGQILCQIGGLVATVDSDDTTGRIAQFTLVNNDTRTFTLTYLWKNSTQTRDIAPGTNITFTPTQNGVKWLTDKIEWSIG